jgi:hypothetical protein
MHNRSEPNYLKYEKDNFFQLNFLIKNVRNFYSKNIVNWQYQNSSSNTGLYFVQVENSYVASQGMIPILLNVYGKETLTAKSESSFLLPEFRGKGIFEALYFHTIASSQKDGVEIIWGFTALSNVWRDKLKFEVFDGIIHDSELQIQFSSDIYSTWNRRQSLANKLKQTFKALVSLSRSKNLTKQLGDCRVELMDTKNLIDVNNILALYNQWGANHSNLIHIEVNREYLNWRICSNPVIQYKIIGIYKKQNLIGLAILNDTENKAYLVDFVVPEKDDLGYCFTELIRFLKHHNSLSHLIYWASHKNNYTKSIHSLFKSHGANCYVNTSMNFVVKKPSSNQTSKIEISDYCINGLWTEGFRI